MRTAQSNLAQSGYGKESRLKILRRTHQSALSLKQSLIQELQDIIAEKDEYIDLLQNRLTGKGSEIRKPMDNSLTKVVDRFSQLSKDYVDLQYMYEKTKEELIQERLKENGDGHSGNQQFKLQKSSDSVTMMQEIKQLQQKIVSLEKEHQEYLLLKDIDTNQLLLSKTTCDNCQYLASQVSSLKEYLHLEGDKSSVEYHNLQEEYTELNSLCTRLKSKLVESESHVNKYSMYTVRGPCMGGSAWQCPLSKDCRSSLSSCSETREPKC